MSEEQPREPTTEEWAYSKLLSYIAYQFNSYIIGNMHRLIAAYLEAVERGDITRLLIFAPPRHGKTALVGEYFAAWYLGRNPSHHIIYTTYNQERGNDVGRRVRDQIVSGNFGRIFPMCSPAKDSKSIKNLSTTQHGEYFNVGMGGAIVGRGADLLIIDDPIKDREEAESRAARTKMQTWYGAVAYTRLMPGGKVIVINTRWHCFHPTTQILTTEGWIVASEVRKDSLLITQKGIEPIKKMESKEYKGDMYEITLYGQPKPIKVTGNHGILTTNGWKHANRITKNDWCIVPQIGGGSIPKFEEPKTSKASCHANLTGVQNRVPKEKLKKLLDAGKTYDQCAKHFGLVGRGSINGYVTLYNLNRNTNTIAPQQLREDPRFWRIVGYWLAEGSLSKARKHYDEDHYTIIVLSIGGHEQWIANDIKNIMEKYKINVSFSPHKEGKAIKVQFSCWQIAQYLKTHFGYHAYGKQLPEWVGSLPQEMKQELLIGYFRGDGCFSNKIGYRAGSVSLKLLTDIQRLFTSMNIPSGIVKSKKAGKYIFSTVGEKTYESNCRESYELRVHEFYVPWMDIKREKYQKRTVAPRYQLIKVKGNQLQLKVKKIKVAHYSGLIYDFETPSNCITAAGVTVHNSNDLSGYLLSEHPQENWTVLDLKAIAEKNDILGRKEGEALWPEFRDLEMLGLIEKAIGTREFTAQFQQRPTAVGGGMVKYEWIKYYEDLPKEEDVERTIVSWDTAYKPEQIHDPTAATVWQITRNGYYLIYVLNERLEFPDLVKELKRVHNDYHPSAHLVEGRATGQSLIQQIKRDTAIPIIEISTKNINSEIRFDAITPFFESGKVWFPKQAHWLSEAKDQICSFPAAPHDDIADSTSQFLDWIANKPRYVRKPASKLYWK